MFDAERSPYDVLGLTPAATAAEVHAAYERTLSEVVDPAEQRACAAAYDVLRSAGRRVGADLLEYAAPDSATTARDAFAGVAEDRFLSKDTPPPPPIAALVVLRRAETVADHHEPPPTQGTFAIPARFSATADVLPPVDIPR
ncbi:hypothetical protein [Streptomyces sp. SID3343]|uniref:hypothetical protein n=1 Tax=Streptomyces sp. SID3343 TaxID=2690260 RepID=UPI0013704F0C|nr:hypothetical protein [Streptomyces sp. SID3343]MYV99225.1 hypothetical protein [Streptomyces sp. SID3343]